jgi:glycosyltransferase involved in cell wall biosynthesis
MNASVSVVLPVYNHRDFVADAIRSVFEQTLVPNELIIIDDGSSDGSPEIVREFLAANTAPEGLSVLFETRENRGAHITINEGVKCARGDYVAILNSDDRYMSSRLERCLHTARTQKSRFVFTYVEGIDASGAPLPAGHWWRIWYNHATLLNIQEHDCISQTLLYGNIAVSTGNFFIHRSLFEEIGYFSGLRYCHDWDFLLRACFVEEPVVLREKLYKYRIHGGNTALEPDNYAIEETKIVLSDHLRAVFRKTPKNKWDDILGEHSFSFGAGDWLGLVGPAFDMLLERPQEPQVFTPTPLPRRGKANDNGKRVTILSHEMTYTGAPTIVLELTSALLNKGAAVDVLTQIDGPLRQEFKRLGVSVRVIKPATALQRLCDRLQRHVERRGRNRRAAKAGREIARSLLKISQAVRLMMATRNRRGTLLVNSFASWPVALKLLQQWRGPAFWYVHETYEPEFLMPKPRDNRQLKSFFSAGRVKMLYGSDATRSLWASHGYEGAVHYWSGISRPASAVPLRSEKSADVKAKARKTVLSIGTAGGRKGTRHLVEAFAIGRSRGLIGDDVELCIVGCRLPSQHAATRDLVRRVHRPDLFGFVRLLPVVEPSALAAYLDGAQLYVQSSLMEGVPIALLAAMSRGLPVVTTDVDGCKEAVIDGVCGLLVSPRQEVEMAEAIGRLLNDQDLAARLGDAAKQRFADRFSLEATFEPIYETLML